MHFRVGKWIVITKFHLSPASGVYRYTNHVYKMQFGDQTTVTNSDMRCNNMFLDLKDFATILNGSLDTRYLIGIVFFVKYINVCYDLYITVLFYDRRDWSGNGLWRCGYY